MKVIISRTLTDLDGYCTNITVLQPSEMDFRRCLRKTSASFPSADPTLVPELLNQPQDSGLRTSTACPNEHVSRNRRASPGWEYLGTTITRMACSELCVGGPLDHEAASFGVKLPTRECPMSEWHHRMGARVCIYRWQRRRRDGVHIYFFDRERPGGASELLQMTRECKRHRPK